MHQETFGKSGCRRIVPGQYLATDPKGRAVMIGAVEKQKLVYILNRDAAARLTISSPLEAHKSHTFVYDVVGMDVGFENPVFACLELDYEDVDEDVTGETLDMMSQTLTFYELDLGTCVTERFFVTVSFSSSFFSLTFSFSLLLSPRRPQSRRAQGEYPAGRVCQQAHRRAGRR